MLWINKKRKLSELNPAEYNPRMVTAKQKEDLSTSLDKFDVAAPIIINLDNTIIGGHQRYHILKEKGWHDVDVRIPERQLTKDEEVELNIRLNKNLGQWDYAALANIDDEILKTVGFTEEEMADMFGLDTEEGLTDPDDIPEVKEETYVKLGDIYQLGEHRLVCGDATSTDAVDRLMNGQKADMVFTDPPYLMGFNGSVHSDGSKSYNSRYGAIKNDKMSEVEGEEFVTKFVSIIERYTLGAFYICFYRLGLDKLFYSLGMTNLLYRALIIWNKGNHTLSNSDYMSKYEPIVYGWVDVHEFNGRPDYDIWEIKRTKKNDLHPTMKPIELCSKAITNSSKTNDKILDLFGGSGSTLIACERLKRKCYMMELDPHYCQVIIERWEQFSGNKAVKL